MDDTGSKNMPEAVVDLLKNSGTLSSADVDECLTKYPLSKEQLKAFADAVVEKVVCDGRELSSRRAFCRARISNAMTLLKISLISSFSLNRLADIENGNITSLTQAECRFFNDLFGISCIPSYTSFFSEPSDGGTILQLSQMSEFSNYQNLSDFAERNGTMKFKENECPGLSGVVIETDAEQVEFGYSGRIFISVSELNSGIQAELSLCRTTDGRYLLLKFTESGFCSARGECFSLDSFAWRLPVRQIVLQVLENRSFEI